MNTKEFLELKVQDISDMLCEKLVENLKKGKNYAGATCQGINNIDGKPVHLSIILSENLLTKEDLE